MLLIDVGNTRIKYVVTSSDQPIGTDEPLARAHNGDFADCLTQLLVDVEVKPQSVFVSNVAGEDAAQAIAQYCDARWRLPVEFARVERTALGVKNGYQRLVELGVDRWVAIHGARHWADGNVIVVNCGTAITVDVLSADNRFIGGAILPGPMMAMRALSQDAAGIPQVPMGNSGLEIGSSTRDCVHAGAWAACAGGVEKMVVEITRQLPDVVQCIVVSGGAAAELLKLVKFDYCYDANLVLRGLARLSQCD